jgi:hypothetical protein
MVNVFVRHRIKDYTVWKQVFAGFLAKRRAGGERTYKVARLMETPTTCAFSSSGIPRRTPNALLRRLNSPAPCNKLV